MQRKFHLSNKSTITHLLRLGALLLSGGAAAAAILYLGLERWSRSEYIYVNVGLLALTVAAGFCLGIYGGFLETRAGIAKMAVLGGFGAAAAGLWSVLTFTDKHHAMAVPIFLLAVVMTVRLCGRFVEMIRNFWKDILAENDGNGNALKYPGRFVLHDVHSTDSMASPFGQVVIGNHSVLFVVTDPAEGYILAKPDGTLEARKQKVFKDGSKEIVLNTAAMELAGAEGARRMMRIVEEECAKRGVEAPKLGYDYAILLPNFEADAHLVGMDAFRGLTWSRREQQYQEYVSRARSADYFDGRTCFGTGDLAELLRRADQQAAAAHGHGCTDAQRDLVAQCIADACGLVEDK